MVRPSGRHAANNETNRCQKTITRSIDARAHRHGRLHLLRRAPFTAALPPPARVAPPRQRRRQRRASALPRPPRCPGAPGLPWEEDASWARSATAEAALHAAAARAVRSGYFYACASWWLSERCPRGEMNATVGAATTRCYARALRTLERRAPRPPSTYSPPSPEQMEAGLRRLLDILGVPRDKRANIFVVEDPCNYTGDFSSL
ncbi:hypothetical protein ACP4OV_019549 [Aristida adscensionis]